MATEHTMLLVIALVAVGLVLAALVRQWVLERARRSALRRLAERLGMRFSTSDPDILGCYASLTMLHIQRYSQARNVLVGRWRGHWLCVFDFYPKGRKLLCYESRRDAPAFTVFVLEHEQEFSEAFCVRSPDRKFAFDVCHPRMMTYLLRHRDMIVEFADDCIALCLDAHPPERHRVEAIPYWLKRLITIRKLLPGYLFEQQEGGRRAVESAGQNP